MQRLNLLEETRFEKIPVTVYPSESEATTVVASRIARLIKDKQAKGENAILGLATGVTPIKVYQELVRLHKEEGLSFKNVVTFNLDEYYPMLPNETQSYVTFMNENLFNHIDVPKENIHIPDGSISEAEVAEFCKEYEQKINSFGGLDIQILGIGRTGHIGFNEPGAAPNSGTRMVTLDDLTRKDASRDFGGKENVPKKAITMGVGSIFKAREIILMAWNKKKAPIIKKAVEGEVSSDIPATYLQLSQNVEFIVDEDAASLLTRFDKPWLTHDIEWDESITKKAVVWLSQKLGKPILKLTDDDYNTHGMDKLVTEKGPAYNMNIKIFNELQHTITGWPGGKPNVDDSQRPERANPAKKNVLLFSPHPDDDVISMGGTFIKLADQGHNVHVAYQTSGNAAVWDDDVLRYLEFAEDFAKLVGFDDEKIKNLYKENVSIFDQKKPNQTDTEFVRKIKFLIRKGEAIAGARFVGLDEDHIHFQDLPFYDRRKFDKNSSYEDDIQQTMELLRKVKPHQVFAAGDFEDPHGTHKVCFDIILEALKRLKETDEWTKDCWLWMYRGAWHEFPIHEIEMAVPLSPQEVYKKRLAIFKHQSQKDLPVFPGDDAREFWVRAEDRTSETAQLYNSLGLAEYEAIEAFVRYKF
ncbi:glucosamine-6-phosphate deaminase [Elizabethkingia meningoseptica]|uniref:glucosamine-6-phosphate deaminase n=1 Tax=Elizabethkingia meningoseptica TaxID=238 RepID=UPI0022F14FE0|nr:glucosamine-6-phosphate deaminase [Elizabethkingia meningoseptica]EJK5330678.1 glucosamine-6-phosphate deaminase [Elizabethkingia meningoseptica]MDE5431858.1 glucosamine-6-phosphate deaminase [Elizabethkingia meningoseptica]MDE5468531.1 glucosamine-6-phosphate deaminase [Elizabethkingia meningoseptica]MDE5475416.1 glucosamine-6-phosphate deaminase [Elizabethkingia meningoseptica]MDE5480073.1 glucosamine-6-phosphate deaminase [Elizabethkingia meningoseptica]